MSLVFRLGERSARCDWSSFALFRDNVQHFAERGVVSARFSALHGLEEAVTAGSHRVDAARLRAEVLAASSLLGRVAMHDAAISLRTRAILTGSARKPQIRGTVPALHAGWQLPTSDAESHALLDSAREFVEAVLSVTLGVVEGDSLHVDREGEPPRFATRDTASPANSGPS